MLYVFDMDSGRMLTFDMSLALDTVQSLKQAIERHHAIPACSQVLLVSGGETLESNNRVCNYAAGTDTNPIFMFSNSLEPRNPPQPWPSIENETEIKSEVDRCLELQPNYQTVVRRAQLAQQILELGKDELKNCDKLVFEQHLQHQGWMAVIANLEDITVAFQDRCNEFDKVFRDHIDRRMEYKEYLESFDDDLQRLAQIPILPPLIQGAEDQPFHAFDDVYNDTGESFAAGAMKQIVDKPPSEASMESAAAKSSSGGEQSVDDDEGGLVMKEPQPQQQQQQQQHSLTLLQWISSNENQKTLKRMAENCTRELEVFDKNVMDNFKDEIEKTVETAKRSDMKEIKGLEERLQGLEGLKRDASKLLAEQSDIAQALLANQQSASRAGDASILPDLCAPHRSQFQQMLKNHKKLRDIRLRCGKAKDELCKNLLQRLKFVIHIENKMCEIDCKLLFYHRCLRRLQKHLGIIEQIHQAPCVYVQAVTEVVRRRIFSTAFLMWASDLACHLLTIYNEEVVRRQEFRYSFDGHFLNTLFPGIDDFPPRFATEAPSIFDSNLPQLSKNDLSELSKHLPDLTKRIQLPNLSAIIDFFSSRSSNSNHDATSQDENVNPTKKLLNIFPHIKDYEKGCESETDTEEYEKIGQMSIDKKPTHQSICIGTSQPDLCDTATCMSVVLSRDNEMVTDDNMLKGLEVHRLQQLIVTMYAISQESIKLLKQQLTDLKAHASNEQQSMRTQLDQLVKAYDDLKTETHNHERELIQRLTVDHELEMNDVTKKLFMKDDEIITLKSEKEQLENDFKELNEKYGKESSELKCRVEELEEKLQEMEKKLQLQTAEKDAAIKALKEDHKNEIESMRCKFKLMTSSKTSPLEMCSNTIDLETHKKILDDKQEEYERDLKKAVDKAVQEALSGGTNMSESNKWSLTASMQQTNSPNSPGRSPRDGQEVFKRILEEKDRQLDEMRTHVNQLMEEHNRLRIRMQSITDESEANEYKEKLKALTEEKEKIQHELEKERAKRAKLSSLALNGGVTINSCSKDDIVLVVWNSVHEQYIIVQESSVLYFLHAESYNDLKLSTVPPNTCPRVCYCIGRVTDKEYCHAKKDENRYKVGKGTKFYRVKVRARSPSSRGEMDRSGTERKKIKRSTDSQSDSSKSMKFERQPSNLISSFAQTDTTDSVMTETIMPAGSSSSDMVDSGVGSQHNKSTSKEQNPTMDEDEEDISLTEDQRKDDDDKRDDEEPIMIKEEITSLDDSDEYRSLEGKEDDTEDTEL